MPSAVPVHQQIYLKNLIKDHYLNKHNHNQIILRGGHRPTVGPLHAQLLALRM